MFRGKLYSQGKKSIIQVMELQTTPFRWRSVQNAVVASPIAESKVKSATFILAGKKDRYGRPTFYYCHRHFTVRSSVELAKQGIVVINSIS